MNSNFKYSEQGSDKQCGLHHRPAGRFCSKIECMESPYLCEECCSLHRHSDNITDEKGFLHSLSQEGLNVAQIKGEARAWEVIKQMKVVGERINGVIEELVLKIQREQYYMYYLNPGILKYKLEMESESWVRELKQLLRDKKQGRITLNLEQEIQAMVTKVGQQLKGLKSISELKAQSSQIIHQSIRSNSISKLTLTDKKVYTLACVPSKIFSHLNKMLVCSSPVSYLYNLDQKTAVPINFPTSHFSGCSLCFFAISPPSTVLQFNFDGSQTDQFVGYKEQVSSICCYQIGQTPILATGYVDGMFEVYGNRSRLHSQKKSQAIVSMAFNQGRLYCASNRSILIYQTKSTGLQYLDVRNFDINVLDISFSLKRLFVSSNERVISINLSTRQVAHINVPVTQIFIQNDLLFLISNNTLKVYSSQTFEEIQTPSINGSSFILYGPSIWILQRDSTDIEVYTIR